MKLSNKLTLLRLLSIIPIQYCVLSNFPFSNVCALILYVVVLFTDYFDGTVARRRNQVSDFGRLFDPLTDKLLTIALFVSFVTKQLFPVWIVIIIISREFVITCFDLLLESGDYSVAFSKGGNFKSISSIATVLIILLLLATQDICGIFHINVNDIIINIAIQVVAWLAMILSVLSGYLFLSRNEFRKILKNA